MQPQTVKMIEQLPHKAVVYAFEGVVQRAFQRATGTNAKGEWAIERFVLKDTNGDEIKLMVKDSPPLNWQAGRRVHLEAYNGEKGYSGLYAHDDEYKGEIVRVLKGTRTMQVQGDAPPQQQATTHHQSAPAQQQAPQQQAPTPAPAPQQQSPPKQQATTQQRRAPAGAESKRALNEARATVMQIVNLHVLCSKAVVGCEVPAVKAATGQGMSESQIQGAIASVFIESCRSGLVRNMPSHPLDI